MCVRGLPPPGRALPRGPCAQWAPQARYEPTPSAPRRRPAARERPARPQAGTPASGPAEGEGVPARPPFPGEARAPGWGERRPRLGHPWVEFLFWRSPCPRWAPCLPLNGPRGQTCEAGRGPRASGFRAPGHRGEGVAALSPGRARGLSGARPGRSHAWSRRSSRRARHPRAGSWALSIPHPRPADRRPEPGGCAGPVVPPEAAFERLGFRDFASVSRPRSVPCWALCRVLYKRHPIYSSWQLGPCSCSFEDELRVNK